MPKSNIGYKGQVTVKVTNKPPVKRKNEGKDPLFNLLSRLLTNENRVNIIKDLPSYINITNDEEGTENIILSPLVISDSSVDTDSVSFYALFNSTNVGGNVPNTEICHLHLLNGGKDKILATVSLNTDDIEAVLSKENNTQCKIEWTLSFGNETEEE